MALTNLVKQIVSDPTETNEPLIASITGESQDEIVLDKASADTHTEYMKNLYGNSVAPVLTQDELDEINNYEESKVVDENRQARLQENIEGIANGSETIEAVQWSASQSAYEKYYNNTRGSITGLAQSSMRQDQAKTLVEYPNLSETDKQTYKAYNDLQQKYAILKEFTDRWNDKAASDGLWTRIKQGMYDAIPGTATYRRWIAGGKTGEFTEYFKFLENTENLRDKFMGAVLSNTISPIELDKALQIYEDFLVNKKGFTAQEMRQTVNGMWETDKGWAWFDAALDFIPLGSATASGIKGSFKGAAKSGIKGAASGFLSGFTFGTAEQIAPLKPFVKDGQVLLNSVQSGLGGAAEKIQRMRLLGSKKNAARGTVEAMKEAAPGIKAEADTILENAFDGIVKPTESVLPSVAKDELIVSEKAYKRMFENMKRVFTETKASIKTLQQEMWENLAESVARETDAVKRPFKYRDPVTNRLVTEETEQIGELIKAVDVDELIGTTSGDLAVRIRYPEVSSDKARMASIASAYAGDKGISTTVVPLSNGEFALDIDIHTSKGFGTLLAEKAGTEQKRWQGFGSLITTATGTPGDIRQLNALRDIQASLIKNTGEVSLKKYKALSKAEKIDIKNIMEKSVQEKKWLSYSYLKSKGMSDKVLDTYSSLRGISDLNFFMVNNETRRVMNQMGIKTISINNKEIGKGRIVRGTDNKSVREILQESNRRIVIDDFDAKPIKFTDVVSEASRGDNPLVTVKEERQITHASGKTYELAGKKMQAKELLSFIDSKLDSDEYVLVELIYGKNKEIRSNSVYYMLPKNSVIESDLPQIVMNYIPGWRRYFSRDGLFLKQLDVRNGMAVGIKTFMSDVDTYNLVETGKILEDMRMAVINNDGLFDYNSAIARLHKAPFTDKESFVKWARENGMDLVNAENKLEVVEHNKILESYKRNLSDPFAEDLLDPEHVEFFNSLSSYEALASQHAMTQRRRSGNTLLTSSFGVATTVDVDEALRYMINDMVNAGVMGRFTDFYSERFAKAYRGLLSRYTSDKNQLSSSRNMLMYGKFQDILKKTKNPEDAKLAASAITAQKNFLVMKGVPTDLDAVAANFLRGALEWAGATADALHVPEQISRGMRLSYQKLVNAKPLQFMRGFVAHWCLGAFGNIGQLAKNFLAPVTWTVALEGSNALKALKHVYPLMCMFNSTDGSVLSILKKYDELAGVVSQERLNLFKGITKMGLTESSVVGGAAEGVKRSNWISRASLYFFNKADLGNRVHAYTTALIHFGFDKKELTKAADIAKVRDFAESLYFNMSSIGLNRLQQGELSKTLTQFLGYTMHIVETTMFDKNLTKLQRRRLGLVMALMVGGSGLFGTDVWNICGFDSNNDPDDKSLEAWMRKIGADGILDAVLQKGFDQDISLKGMFAPQVGDMVRDFAKAGPIEVALDRPVFNVGGKVIDATSTIFRWVKANYYDEVGADKFSDLLKVLAERGEIPNGLKSPTMGYRFIMEGAKYNSKGQLTSEDNHALNVVATALGINSQSSQAIYEAHLREQSRQDHISELKKDVQQYENYAARENDPVWHRVAQLVVLNDDEISDQEKMNILVTVEQNTIKDNLIPIADREAEEYLLKQQRYGENLFK